ncbi:hypothetical protein QR680_008674 [Steinernema hermaphroditum]|uniref:CHK kinase-like domain-containing protein n=1 Tax=Steinernema hermaphroditum TaxID=289476 RepID=A0AA39M8B5_9BILA|nr:hypothetical protein QR680_008674 [Steinernema hermaphroditum]
MDVGGECMDGALFSWIELDEIVRGFLATEAHFGDAKQLEKLGVDQGFLSVVMRLTPDWRGTDVAELPATLVVKVPTSETMMQMAAKAELADSVEKVREILDDVDFRADFDGTIRRLHNNECDFYELVAAENLQLAVPKVFGFRRFSEEHRQGIIVMEDLVCGKLVDGLVALHAFALENPRLEEGGRFDVPMSSVFLDKNIAMVKGMVESIKVARPGQTHLVDNLLFVYDSLMDLTRLKTIPEELDIPNVLLHGDLWISNVFWKDVDGGKKELVAVLDWQVAHFGCVTEDLIRFITLALSGRDRRAHWKELLVYYHRKLEEKLGKRPPFSVDQLEESYKRMFSVASVLLLPAAGPVTEISMREKSVDEEEAARFRAIVDEKMNALLEDVVEGLPREFSNNLITMYT